MLLTTISSFNCLNDTIKLIKIIHNNLSALLILELLKEDNNKKINY